jgi:REP element-mobilizing transposase RayT
VTFYRRRLPHLHCIGEPVFVTWRLYGSLPPGRVFHDSKVSSGRAFAALDRLLDESCFGARHLSHPAIADMVVETLYYAADVQRRHTLHAFAVMPNHVHVLVSPYVPLPRLMKALKGYTAKQGNQILALTGNPFWQEESYDHLVRNAAEGERIRLYIEQNPVRAGLVKEASQYRWSSAGWPTGRSAADQEVRPTF